MANFPESLVFTVALAIRDAHEKDLGIPDSVQPLLAATEWTPEACAATVAVLRALTEQSGGTPWSAASLNRVANELAGA